MLIRHLPAESAVATIARDGRPAWTLEATVIDDLRLSFAGGNPHPLRPKPEQIPSPERQRLLADARRRARQRRERLAQAKETG